jgi:hypothetical protein
MAGLPDLFIPIAGEKNSMKYFQNFFSTKAIPESKKSATNGKN